MRVVSLWFAPSQRCSHAAPRCPVGGLFRLLCLTRPRTPLSLYPKLPSAFPSFSVRLFRPVGSIRSVLSSVLPCVVRFSGSSVPSPRSV